CAAGWAESQIPAAASQVSQVKNCLGKLDASLRRQTLAAQKAKGDKSKRNRDHCETIGARDPATGALSTSWRDHRPNPVTASCHRFQTAAIFFGVESPVKNVTAM